MEIIYLQIRERVRFVQRLEKQTAELFIRAHRTSRIDQQQQLQPVFSRRLHPYIEDPSAAACAVDRSTYIQLLFAVFKLSRQFSQQPECHLELSGLDGAVGAPVPELSVAARVYHAFPAGALHHRAATCTRTCSDPCRSIACDLAAPERRTSEHGAAAAVAVTLRKPSFHRRHYRPQIHIIFIHIRRESPFHELRTSLDLRDLSLQLLRTDIPEIPVKQILELVQIALRFDEQRPAKNIESPHRLPVKP